MRWLLVVFALWGCATNPTSRCAVDRDCPAAAHECYRGLCVPRGPTDAGRPDAPRCPIGRTLCDDMCVDLLTSRDHCGGCDNDCRGGGQMCRLGVCIDD